MCTVASSDVDFRGLRNLVHRYARPGDRLTVSDLYRLCQHLVDILVVR